MQTRLTETLATTAYAGKADQQCFLSVNSTSSLIREERRIQSSYGWLRPVRVLAHHGVDHTFIYPRSLEDPSADDVQSTFHLTQDGFESVLGSVRGTLYSGRTSAGGEGIHIDVTGNGKPNVYFASTCRFLLQLNHGKITAVEADRATRVDFAGQSIDLKAFVPAIVSAI